MKKTLSYEKAIEMMAGGKFNAPYEGRLLAQVVKATEGQKWLLYLLDTNYAKLATKVKYAKVILGLVELKSRPDKEVNETMTDEDFEFFMDEYYNIQGTIENLIKVGEEVPDNFYDELREMEQEAEKAGRYLFGGEDYQK